MEKQTTLNQNEIAARAYHIWEVDGRPTGSEIRYWLQAEEELRAAQNTAAETSPKPMQKAPGQLAEHAATPTAKPQTRRQAAPMPEPSRRGQAHAAAA
jgi:hypothetical protein